MEALSAVKFFSEAFDWFAKLSSKLPKIDFKTYFIVVVVLLLGVGLIVALTFFGTYRFKLTRACRRIIRYLAGVEFIDDDNVSDFTAQCFSTKAPSVLRDSWVQYLGVRFGYPSDIVSEQNVYDKEVKRVREIRANVYIAIALILLAIFSFWGYGTLDGKDMGVIFLAGLLLSGVIYLVLVILNKIQSKTCLNVLSEMQEDLDAKVILQVEKSFATDSSPLMDLSAIVDEIVARNTAKDIGFENVDIETPIEMLIAQSSIAQESAPVQEESVEDFDDIMKESFDGLELDDSSEDTHVEENEDRTVDTAEDASVAEDTHEPAQEDVDQIVESVENVDDKTDDTVDEAIYGEIEAIDGEVGDEVEENTSGETEDSVEISEALIEKREDNEQKALIAPEEEGGDESAVEGENASEENTDVLDDLTEDAKEESDNTEVKEDNSEESVDGGSDETKDVQSMDEAAVDSEAKPKVIVVEDYVEDEETVKPAKLVKLPNLIDYMLAIKPSRKLMMQLATLLLSAYAKFKDSEEDRKIVIGCMKKVMFALQSSM